MVYAVGAMSGLLNKHGKRRVFILGAGFNAPLGLPLTVDLLKEVHAVAKRKPWRRQDGEFSTCGMADWLVEVLGWYYPTAGISHEDIVVHRMPEVMAGRGGRAPTTIRAATCHTAT
jgi:hypothetical protein